MSGTPLEAIVLDLERSRSPPRGRYRCDPPKFPPSERERGIPALSKRYRGLYIPGDFCRATACWLDSVHDWAPLPLTHHVAIKLAKVGCVPSHPPLLTHHVKVLLPKLGGSALHYLTPRC